MAGKGGGAWKVAYADFVTAMMAFFLVMWITAQSKPVKQAIAQYFNDPFMSSGGSAGAASSLAPGTGKGDASMIKGPEVGLPTPPFHLPDRRRQASKSDGSETGVPKKPGLLVLHDGNRQTAGTIVLFAEESAELTAESKLRLKGVVPLLLGKRNKIELRGHATRRPLSPGSPFQDSWQLCYQRCLAVTEFLEQEGVERDRIRMSQAGPFEPYTLRTEPEKQAQNSRVELYVLPERVEDLLGTAEERAERFRTP